MNDGRITKATYFKTGMGYFVKEYEVDGNEEITLTVSDEDMNDILKSIHVVDKGGGSIAEIGFPNEASLYYQSMKITKPYFIYGKSFNTNLKDIFKNQTEILKYLISQPLNFKTSKDHFKGRLLSVNNFSLFNYLRDLEDGFDTSISTDESSLAEIIKIGVDNRPSDSVSILLENGYIKIIPLQEIVEFEILDKTVKDDFDKLYDFVSKILNTKEKSLVIRCTGEGKRIVEVSYSISVPIWKMNYRFDLYTHQDTNPKIQSYAIVDNLFTADFEDISLTLIGGKPISFQFNMTSPNMGHRKEKSNKEHFSTYDFGPPEVYLDAQAYYKEEHRQRRLREEEFAREQQATREAAMFAAEEEYSDQKNLNNDLSFDEIDALSVGGDEIVKPSQDTLEPPNMNHPFEGNFADAKMKESLIEYQFKQKINIKKGESSLIPFFTEEVDSNLILLYNKECRWNPFSAILFINNTETPFEYGPASIYIDGSYSGESILNRCLPGDKAILTYAQELGVMIDSQSGIEVKDVYQITFSNGLLKASYHKDFITLYHIRNNNNRSYSLYIEKDILKNTELIKPEESEDRIEDHYQFRIELEPNQVVDYRVVQRKEITNSYKVDLLKLDNIVKYQEANLLSNEMSSKLEQVIELNREISNVETDIDRQNGYIQDIEKDHKRVRENLKALGESKAEAILKEKYVKKISESEDDIASTQKEIKKLNKQLKELENQRDNIIKGLNDSEK